MELAENDFNEDAAPNQNSKTNDTARVPDGQLDVRAREIGLRATIAYISESALATVGTQESERSSNRGLRAKDRARKNKEREEKEKAGFVQFNRYIPRSLRQQADALFTRLGHTYDWRRAILSDPAVIETESKLLEIAKRADDYQQAALERAEAHQKAVREAEINRQEAIEARDRLDEIQKLYRGAIALSAAQQRELEELKPLAQRGARTLKRIDELELAEQLAVQISRCRGWRRALLRIAGITPPPLWSF